MRQEHFVMVKRISLAEQYIVKVFDMMDAELQVAPRFAPRGMVIVKDKELPVIRHFLGPSRVLFVIGSNYKCFQTYLAFFPNCSTLIHIDTIPFRFVP